MKLSTNWKYGVILVIGMLLISVVLLLMPSLVESRRQAKNMDLAASHLAKLRIVIKNDQSFSGVRVDVLSAYGGCVAVRGEVDSEPILARLKTALQSTTPPVELRFFVELRQSR